MSVVTFTERMSKEV